MLKFTQFFSLVMILLFSGCNNPKTEIKNEDGIPEFISNGNTGEWQSTKSTKVTLEEVDKFDFIDNEQIGSISSLRVHSNGDIYFLDFRQSRIVWLDPQGNIKQTAGQPGRGPGDIASAKDLILSDEFVFLSNMDGVRVDQFDLSLNFVRSIQLPENIRWVTFGGITSDDKVIVISNIPGETGTRLMAIDYKNPDNSEIFYDFDANEIDGKGSHVRGKALNLGNGIAYTYPMSYQIDLLTEGGKKTSSITRELDSVVGPATAMVNGGLISLMLGFISEPFELNQDYFLVDLKYPLDVEDRAQFVQDIAANRRELPTYKRALDVFNDQGRLMFVYEDDGFLSNRGRMHAVHNETLYFVESEEGLSISKVKVISEKLPS